MIKDLKVATTLAPAANAFAGTVTSTPVNMSQFEQASFLIVKGVGATGTSLVTVEKCSDAAGAGAEAIPFKYRRIPSADAPGDIANATAAGFTTSAGSNDLYVVYASVQLEGLAKGDKPFVRVKMVEQTASPVAGCILALGTGARYGAIDSTILS